MEPNFNSITAARLIITGPTNAQKTCQTHLFLVLELPPCPLVMVLIASGRNASPELLVSTIANGTTAFLIILAMTVGLIFPRMCIEHFRSGFAKLNPRGSREHLSARNV
jgi:hypothetical protein